MEYQNDAQVAFKWLSDINAFTLKQLSPKRTDRCSGCGDIVEVQNVRFGRLFGVAVCARCLITEQTALEKIKSEASNGNFDFSNEEPTVVAKRVNKTDTTNNKVKKQRRSRSKANVKDSNQMSLFDLYEQTLNDVKNSKL